MIASSPTRIHVALNATNSGVTTGLLQAVVLPSDITFETLTVEIQVHNGSTSDFTSFASAPPVFHFSKTNTEDSNFRQCVGSISVDVSAPAGTTIGYVRAASGQYVVLTVLAA